MPTTHACRPVVGAIAGALVLGPLTGSSGAAQYEIRRVGYHPSGWNPDQIDHAIDARDGWIEGYTELNGVVERFWMYDVGADTATPLGLIDDAHAFPEPTLMADNGFAAGTSERIDPDTASYRGTGVWIYDPNTHTTTEAGLYADPEFVDDSGHATSAIDTLNSAGYAAGSSSQYHDADGNYRVTEVAWVYDPTTTATIPVSLTGPDFNPSLASTTVRALSLDGQAAGDTTDAQGRHRPWIFDITTGTITPIGSGAPDFPALALGEVDALTNSGYVLGHAIDPWLYDPASGTTIPLPGPPGSGFDTVEGIHVNEAGLVLGLSSNSAHTDSQAWIYDPVTGQYHIVKTGLDLGPNTAYLFLDPALFNSAGDVAGSAAIFAPSGTRIASAEWCYDHTTDTGREIVPPPGPTYSMPAALDDQGRVLLYDAWSDVLTTTIVLDDPASGSLILGPHGDAVHPGTTYSAPTISRHHYAGQTMRGVDYALGGTGWIYNADTGLAHAFDLSVRSDGFADSWALLYTDRGVAIGYYHAYGPHDEDLGIHPFRWTPNTGTLDIEALIVGPTLADFGVSALPGGQSGYTSLVGQTPAPYIVYAANSTLSNHAVLLAFVEIPSPPCVADLDADFDVDVFDFGVFATHFGATVPPGTSGDFNDDGAVDVADFGVLAADFYCNP